LLRVRLILTDLRQNREILLLILSELQTLALDQHRERNQLRGGYGLKNRLLKSARASRRR